MEMCEYCVSRTFSVFLCATLLCSQGRNSPGCKHFTTLARNLAVLASSPRNQNGYGDECVMLIIHVTKRPLRPLQGT